MTNDNSSLSVTITVDIAQIVRPVAQFAIVAMVLDSAAKLDLSNPAIQEVVEAVLRLLPLIP